MGFNDVGGVQPVIDTKIRAAASKTVDVFVKNLFILTLLVEISW